MIEVYGYELSRNPIAVKRSIGYIPDEPWAYPYLTAREFLELTGDLHGLERKETHKRINEFAQLYGIESLLDGVFEDFSRGNKQKTIIVGALLHRPKLLVIDEPIVGLDAASQQVTKSH